MNSSKFVKVVSSAVGAVVALAVVVFAFNAITGEQAAPGSDEQVAERIKPIGHLALAANAVMETVIPAANAADKGKSTYDMACVACHGPGVAGAPKLGDKAAWKDRISQGMAVLDEHAIKGYQGKKGVMPAKGGNMSLSDADVKAAVAYMVDQSK